MTIPLMMVRLVAARIDLKRYGCHFSVICSELFRLIRLLAGEKSDKSGVMREEPPFVK